MIDERLQQNFRLVEFVRSQTAVRLGIDNTPTPQALGNIRALLAPGMQRVRNCLATPLFISSGYRGPDLNKAVRGSASSQHTAGLAADFVADGFGTSKTVVRYLMERSGEIRFDQLIYEGTWVHISFVPEKPRSQVLTAHFNGGRVTYSQGLA
jgi:zinc D-Ala-D-Ala carboxypeptidase